MIRVVIIDGEKFRNTLLEMAFKRAGMITYSCGPLEAHQVDDTISLLQDFAPDVVVVDMNTIAPLPQNKNILDALKEKAYIIACTEQNPISPLELVKQIEEVMTGRRQ